jgi:hypothetical protein
MEKKYECFSCDGDLVDLEIAWIIKPSIRGGNIRMSVQSPNSGAVYASWNDEASAGANQVAANQIAQSFTLIIAF